MTPTHHFIRVSPHAIPIAVLGRRHIADCEHGRHLFVNREALDEWLVKHRREWDQ